MKTKLTTEQIERLYNLGLNVINLDEMLSILPKKITDRRKIYNLTMGVNSEDLWYAKYMNDHDCYDELGSYQDAHELCDCIYNMIVWLKTNKIQEL